MTVRISAELRREGSGDFARFREAPRLLLGENDLVVEGHVKDPAMPFDQASFEAELALDLVRQTGGSWQVASGSAVFDDKSVIHPNSPFVRIIQGGVEAWGAAAGDARAGKAALPLSEKSSKNAASTPRKCEESKATTNKVRDDRQSETNFRKKIHFPSRFLVQSLYNIVSTIGETPQIRRLRWFG